MSAARQTYHHGDLRRALLEEGLELAREGGPDAVVLREATRRAGVSANAAYRHFADRDALLADVVSRAQAEAADVIARAIAEVDEFAEVDRFGEGGAGDPASRARARFRAVGVGYLRFALTEPGLFRTAFAVPTDLSRSASPDAAGAGGRTPFQLLSDQLDEMLVTGVLPAAERPGAELLAWSAVHGLAMLALEGPLRDLPRTAIDALTPRLVRMVDLGLGVVRPPSG
ncbi:TetR/AcrR family transcriptional regulator [Intrasporangium calvum]|uniref:Transcriptional regulator, TetR family n=1 Tax=Intrasporangium calvum (strain ATCC 23552 / DSM 43043 / JCM 3097 / NBRC 12989 / NCIMB 10167 / NRRL B-3866 / 7 KIP) TaxID=710696 RepID=E6SEC2_INTC7|nr:TetR/AcrR family transcriptional regulator [Intrasporangium calvum]ADU49799.1 transcriptional regulator, TetR family [Intrasporangium calvum DSM 43043]